MRRIFMVGVVIALLILLLIFTLKRPKGDAATSVAPEVSPTHMQLDGDDVNQDGMVDERDAALYEH